MPVTVVVGAQWGDEGKGKIVDFLAKQADYVIRFQGGPNAGHTIINEFGEFKLHGVPSGIFRPKVNNIIGAGCVIAPDRILSEINELKSRGAFQGRLLISDRTHIIMPYHYDQEEYEERLLGERQIGTTHQGIGPVYADKYGRWGLRAGDIAHPVWLKQRLQHICTHRSNLAAVTGSPVPVWKDLYRKCRDWYRQLKPYICDILPLIDTALIEGRNILLEGQLGAGKGVDWGSYPFVTSSSPTAGNACSGAGIAPCYITQVVGVVKAYSTSVGAGPMVTRDETGIGPRLRELGSEFGATTGRPRKCGWIDMVMLRHSARVNGYTSIAVTRLDVLDTLDTIGICTGYRYKRSILTDMPITPVLESCEPVYEYMSGWKTSVRNIRRWNDLPVQAQHYIKRISEAVRAPVSIVSVGPKREELIVC